MGLCVGASWEREETLGWKLGSVCVCVCTHLRGPIEESQTVSSEQFINTASYYWSPLSPRETLLCISFMHVALSNVAIMSTQIKWFHFITKLSKAFCLQHVVQFQNSFRVTHLAFMDCASICFIGNIIKYDI